MSATNQLMSGRHATIPSVLSWLIPRRAVCVFITEFITILIMENINLMLIL